MLTDQSPPAEVSVIGSMLIDERCIPELMRCLTAEDFSDGTLRHLFEAIRGLWLARSPVDPVTVLDAAGSKSYEPTIRSAMRETPTAANCMAHARILREQRQLREIQSACMEIINAGTDLSAAREILRRASLLLVDRQSARRRTYADMVADFLSRYDDKEPPDYLDWGIPALNEKLPIGPGRFVILGADSSVGKTALALQFAMAMARKKRVGFFSYETTLEDAGDRLIANDADASLGRIKHRRLSHEDLQRIVAAGQRAGDMDLAVDESARYTVEDLRAQVIAWGYEVIFVDYVQLIPTRRAERYDAVTEISIQLHAMAQELGVTVIGLSQVTVPETDKQGNRRYITMQDLRESRQLKQDADVIMLLDLSDPTDRNSNRVLQIGKNRDGELTHLVLGFDAPHMRFSYIPPMEDTAAAAARERTAKMDANRAAKQKKQSEMKQWLEDQVSVFAEIPPGEEDPF